MDLVLGQFNLDSVVPTFFEMRAQEDLMDNLKGAFRYALTVTAQREPRLVNVLRYADEIFLALWAYLDWKSLSSLDATFCEDFYGLKRVVVGQAAPPALQDNDWKPVSSTSQGTSTARGELGPFQALTRRDRIYTLVVTILVPYLREKVAEHVARFNEAQNGEGEEEAGRWSYWSEMLAKAYPWVNMAYELVVTIYWVRYLFESQWWSPWNHARRIVVKRLDYNDYMRSRQASSLVVDAGRYGLTLLVVVFKLLEWWHSTESVRQQADEADTSRISAPPPPPGIQNAPAALPETSCPQCRQRVTNPTLNAASGVVYCYPCVHQYVEAHKHDPLTQIPCTLEHLRRVYESAS
eukprot:Hpha_TRINITY_DN6487_c0_g1::TRINITY_DN6487_c0_g1_i1::g.268::m.268/K13345/PEX12, PAF3; peroxin-12